MIVTFYQGEYTRRTGQSQKGLGEKISTDSVERLRIELPGGDVIDRPASKRDVEQYAKEYGLWKAPPPKPEKPVAHSGVAHEVRKVLPRKADK